LSAKIFTHSKFSFYGPFTSKIGKLAIFTKKGFSSTGCIFAGGFPVSTYREIHIKPFWNSRSAPSAYQFRWSQQSGNAVDSASFSTSDVWHRGGTHGTWRRRWKCCDRCCWTL